MRINFSDLDLDGSTNGLEIAVGGFKGSPTSANPEQVYIEVYQGKLLVHVWDGTSEDPQTIAIERQPETVKA